MKIGIVGRGYFGTKIYETVKKEHDIVFFTGRELLVNYDVDWVVVASSNDSHYSLVKDFLTHKINVFCEKPLTLNFSESIELLNLAERLGVKLYVDDIFLHNSEYLSKREEMRKSQKLLFKWNKFGSFKDNIINNLTYHDLYILIDLFGYETVRDMKIIKNRINEKVYNFKYGTRDITLSYDRLFMGNPEKTIVYENDVCDFSNYHNNPLQDMFSAVFDGKSDFKRNTEIVLESERLLRSFRNYKPKLAVVGGGIFGVSAAVELQKDFDVILHETNFRCLNNASTINQYRIHRGYHYPRSKETASSSKNGNESFLKTYDCLSSNDTKNYYCIAKTGSKTNAEEYIQFLKSSGLEFRQFDLDVLKDENLSLTLEVVEKLFDPEKLRKSVENKIIETGLPIIFGSTFTREMKNNYDYVINCSYANVNHILEDNQQFDCQFELCEKPVVRMTDSYKGKSIVIMDGPFMCVDPFGSTENHVMGNVVHAIHTTNVGKFPEIPKKYKPLINRGVVPAEELVGITNFGKFISSASLFFKEIESTKHIGSMFTVRTVLPMKEHDDARPSLIKKHDSKVYTIFSGKISTCVDCATNLKETLLKQ